MLINWNPDPILMNLFGPFSVRWYGLLFLAGFAISYQFAIRMCRRENLPSAPLENVLMLVIAGTLIGARLGHCLFYEPEHYLRHPFDILKVWEGGLASHGGGLGVIVVLFLYSRRNSAYSFSWLLDRTAIFTAFTGGFIRLGNLMNSEILGKPTDGTWGFVFSRVDQIPRHPTQIYESLSYFVTALMGYLVYRKYKAHPPALLLLGTVLSLIFTFRIAFEFFKENQVAFESSLPLNMGQLLSVPYLLIGLFLVMTSLARRQTPVASSKKKRD